MTVFSFSSIDDPISQAIRESASEFLTVPHDLAEARRIIADRELDLLVYPDIGMEPITYFLAFSRLAPAQCVMWGHPDTTGVRNLDYFLSYAEMEPEGADEHYSERLVRLDTSSVPAMAKPQMPKHRKTRSDFGLPEDAHLYVCPQSLFKLHPDFDGAARKILEGDPKGRLVLFEGSQRYWREALTARFLQTMPTCSERVIFVARVGREDFRNLLSVCDVMLDSFHFGGGGTCLDGFVAGTPIVTLPGRLMRGQYAAVCNRRVGVEDCIASSVEQYVELALRLACEPAFRETVKMRIAENHGSLFEDRQAVQVFEEFFSNASLVTPQEKPLMVVPAGTAI